jgi:sporulation protein YlmC with PRC-barrel domain
VIWVITSRWQVRIVSEDLADREDSRRRAAISLLLSKARLVLAGDPRSPGDAVFPKQHRERSSHRNPLSAAVSLEYSQLAAHGVPCRRNSEDQLRAISGKAFGIHVDGKQPKQRNREAAQERHKFYKEVILTIPPVVFTSAATTRDDFFCVGSHEIEPKQISLMKTLFAFGAMLGVLSLAVAPTIAQTQTTGTGSNTTYIETSKFIGKPVKSSQGEEIGTVKDVVLDRNTGCMAYTVLSTTGGGGGGVSGGGKMVAVPWTVYSPTSDVSALTVTVERQRIYDAPVFDYARIEEYSRPEYISSVYSYYGVSQGAAVGVGVSGGTSTTTTGAATTTTGAATGAGARAGATTSPGAGAPSPAGTPPPAATRSPMGTASPGRSPNPHATAGRSPHATPSERARETPSTRGGTTERSPAEGTRGTKSREETTPPSSRREAERSETGTRSESARAPSEEGTTGEKAAKSQNRERGGKREATPPPERQ